MHEPRALTAMNTAMKPTTPTKAPFAGSRAISTAAITLRFSLSLLLPRTQSLLLLLLRLLRHFMQTTLRIIGKHLELVTSQSAQKSGVHNKKNKENNHAGGVHLNRAPDYLARTRRVYFTPWWLARPPPSVNATYSAESPVQCRRSHQLVSE